jgi:hypothetical protein
VASISLCKCVYFFLVEHLILNNLLWAYNIYGHRREETKLLERKNFIFRTKNSSNELSSAFVVLSFTICFGGKAFFSPLFLIPAHYRGQKDSFCWFLWSFAS